MPTLRFRFASLLILPLLAVGCGSAGARPPAAAPGAPAPTGEALEPATPRVEVGPVAAGGLVLEPADSRVASGDKVTLSLVNRGQSAHAFTAAEASSSCGRFQWYVELIDAAGQHYDLRWNDIAGPCGHVFIPEHVLRFEPGQVATEIVIDTKVPWYAQPPTTHAAGGLVASSSTEPPKRALAPGRYLVIVRGGDVVARANLEIR